ncbi:hypothetical protein diail_8905 [Diaporthe ilicicola]|nr:hypothetical protein diail_8905 [Diaporthe ilicicola]
MELSLIVQSSAERGSTDQIICELEEENRKLPGEMSGLEGDKPGTRCLQDLPVETLCKIFEHLPDLESLLCAVRSCRKLLSVWNENRAHLIANRLGLLPGVLPEAASAAAFPTAPLSNGGDHVGRFGSTIRITPFPVDVCIAIKSSLSFAGARNRCDPGAYNLHDARRLESLHPIVSKLADVYIQQCAASNQALSGTLRERRVTRNERARIERAFYRFETFRRAFGPLDGRDDVRPQPDDSHGENRIPDWLDDPVPELVQDFKECFDTVELIKLHCIYGFLKKLVTPAINDLIWHGCLDMDEDHLVEHWATDRRVAAVVLAGLQNVYDIWAAFNRRDVSGLALSIRSSERDQLSRRFPRKHDTAFYRVLCAGLYTGRTASVQVTEKNIAAHDTDYSSRDACLAVAPSIWDLGKQSEIFLRNEADSLSSQRGWGFVMWDRSRLDMMGFFEHPGKPPRMQNIHLSDNLAEVRTALIHRLDRLYHQFYIDMSYFVFNLRFRGPVLDLGPREYNTWYPLPVPQNRDDAGEA